MVCALNFTYATYVPTWNAKLQAQLMYEDEPQTIEVKQQKPTLEEEATDMIQLEETADEPKLETQDEEIDYEYESDDDSEDNFADCYNDYWCAKRYSLFHNRDAYYLQRKKKSNKKERINYDRWVSTHQQKREERRQACIVQNLAPWYPPPVLYAKTEAPENQEPKAKKRGSATVHMKDLAKSLNTELHVAKEDDK